ncbi:MAG: EamA family transporter [Verrucomicrobia bacterium]|nr:EamA family transporter [Verrucomicrobiota bacterium]
MWLLVLVSFIWAFSFGLIKGRLAGLDSAFIAAARLGFALLVFLPFLRLRGLTMRTALALNTIGAVQFGLMYLAYNESFRHLRAHEVALFTITTPILVTLFADALERTLRLRALLAALLAVIATVPVALKSTDVRLTLAGIALVQLSNAAFAAGQVLYKRLCARQPGFRAREVFGLLYGGAFVVTLAAFLSRASPAPVVVTPAQLWTLAYLGVLASGFGFFLWNVGATRVGAGTLAVMNNAKIPLAVACSLIFFGERADLPWLLTSLALLGAAVFLAKSEEAP